MFKTIPAVVGIASLLGFGLASTAASGATTYHGHGSYPGYCYNKEVITYKSGVSDRTAPGGLRFSQLASLYGTTWQRLVQINPRLTAKYFGKPVPRGVMFGIPVEVQVVTWVRVCPTPSPSFTGTENGPGT